MPPQQFQHEQGDPSISDEFVDHGLEPLIILNDSPVERDGEETSGGNNNKDVTLLRICCKNGDNDASSNTIRVNHNVFLNLLLSVLCGISNSLWNGTAYVAYLKKMGHGNNGPVGEIEALSGLA